jgi:hypothetical protein
MGRRRDLDEVAPRRRLAARQMDLQHAEACGLGEHARPGSGIELIRARIERQRIGAVGTAERAAMGELRQEPERGRQRRITRLRLRALQDVHGGSSVTGR